jgi:nicotinamidase-related amidase
VIANMRTINAQASTLLVVDLQSRLIPAIDQGATVIANARRLVVAAQILGVPALFTEQNAKGLGPTLAEFATLATTVVHKMTFDATQAAGFLDQLPNDRVVVVSGCEAHVCVSQTVLGLIEHGRGVVVVRDAIGSRRAESKENAIQRMMRHGAEIVTTEMAIFEWLGTAQHPRFREVLDIVKTGGAWTNWSAGITTIQNSKG